MHRTGHIGAGLLVYAPIGAIVFAFTPQTAVLGGVVVVGLAMVPDYDQRIPGLSHRGVTHTVYFAGIVGTILGLLGLGLGASVSVPAALGGSVFGFLVGMATIGSHILADMLTPAGVDPLHHGNRRSYELVRSDSTLANYGLFALGALAIGGAVLIGRTLAPIL